MGWNSEAAKARPANAVMERVTLPFAAASFQNPPPPPPPMITALLDWRMPVPMTLIADGDPECVFGQWDSATRRVDFIPSTNLKQYNTALMLFSALLGCCAIYWFSSLSFLSDLSTDSLCLLILSLQHICVCMCERILKRTRHGYLYRNFAEIDNGLNQYFIIVWLFKLTVVFFFLILSHKIII